MPIDVDARHLPIVRIVHSGPATDEELEAYHDELVRLMRKAASERRKFAYVIDGRNAEPADAQRRRRIAAWVTEHSALIKVAVSGMAIVIDSVLLRAVLKALMWMRPYPVSYRVFSSLPDAEAWARATLPGHALVTSV